MIAEQRWEACNRNLLLYKEIQNSITKEDIVLFESTKKNYNQQNNTPIDSLFIRQSKSDTITISDLTVDANNHNGRILSLKYSSDDTAMVVVANTFKKVHDVTTMFDFDE